jgi:hypothetical protein
MQELVPDPVFLIAGGFLFAAIAFGVWRMQRRNRARHSDLFHALGTTPSAAKARVASPPVDLSQPIAGKVAWAAIRRHAGDVAYRRAVETLRLRYQVVTNPMLLSNTLHETMRRGGLTFREAVLRVAEDDGLHGHR